MPYRLLIAVAAGLVSAVVFASATTGPLLMRMVLFLLTPLALFLAGLGLGPLAAAVAGDRRHAPRARRRHTDRRAGLRGSAGNPGRRPHLSRPAQSRCADGSVEWYPIGRLIIVAAILAGVFSSLTLMLLGGDIETLRTALREMLQTFVNNELPKMPGRADARAGGDRRGDRPSPRRCCRRPSAISTMGSLLFNFWLAGRITLASGRLQRPWPDFPPSSIRRLTPLLLAVATGAAFLAGLPGLIAAGFAGPLFLAYVLLGLAVVHYMTRGRSWRPFALWGALCLALHHEHHRFAGDRAARPRRSHLADARISPPPKPPPPT